MKKLLYLVVGGAISFSASAQEAAQTNVPKIGILKETHNFVEVNAPARTTPAAAKTTASNPRWYTPYDIINALNNSVMDNAANRNFFPMWFDSTMYIKYSNNPTPSSVNFASGGVVIDPIGAPNQMFNDVSFNNTNTMQVQSFDSYTIDSIELTGAYVKNQNRPTSVVDTLVLSIAPQQGFRYYTRSQATGNLSWITTYLPSGRDTLSFFVSDGDSVNRCAFSDVGDSAVDRKIIKIPLTDADRDTINTQNNTITVRTWRFEVPGGFTMPAGARIGATVAFKSGDTWVPRVDTIQGFHHFRLLSGAIDEAAPMQYNLYTPLMDRNHSSLMFTTNGRYTATMVLEGVNGPTSYVYEHNRIGVHVVCSSCWVLDVKNTEGALVKAGAYPNPSVSYVNIPFELSSAADVTVTVSNTLGQVVRSEKVANTAKGEVTFNTNSLNNGMYLYTVDVNGQRTTGRFTVAH